MDFGILTVFWYFGHLQFQNENASILQMKSAPSVADPGADAEERPVGGEEERLVPQRLCCGSNSIRHLDTFFYRKRQTIRSRLYRSRFLRPNTR